MVEESIYDSHQTAAILTEAEGKARSLTESLEKAKELMSELEAGLMRLRSELDRLCSKSGAGENQCTPNQLAERLEELLPSMLEKNLCRRG